MLGRRNPQLTFMDMGWRERIPKNHYAWKLEMFCRKAGVTEDMFAELFSNFGRPSVSPVITFRAILYQLEMGLSDRELEEASAFDDRAKLALGLGRDDAPLDAVTLCDHRRRFLGSDHGWRLLYTTLQMAVEQGLLHDGDPHITDSFLVRGRGAMQDNVTLIRKAVLQVLRFAGALGLDEGLKGVLRRDDYERNQGPRRWSSDEARQEFLKELVLDARNLLAAVRGLSKPQGNDSGWKNLCDAADLLERLVDQEFQEDADGTIDERKPVAKSRVRSATDPEMRWTKKGVGYNANIIVGGSKGNIVTDVSVGPGDASDSSLATEGVDRMKAHGLGVDTLVGDSSYGGGDFRTAMENRAIDVYARVPAGPTKGGRYAKEKFEVNMAEGWVRCPQGHTTHNWNMTRDEFKRPVRLFRFDQETCAQCPVRHLCTSAATAGRTITTHFHEELLQEKREFQKTDEFKEMALHRLHVERTIAHLTRRGGRYTRYFGLFKTAFQILMVALGHNIKQVMSTSAGGMPAMGAV